MDRLSRYDARPLPANAPRLDGCLLSGRAQAKHRALTDDAVREIRRRVREADLSGLSRHDQARALGAVFHAKPATIYSLLSRDSYRWVKD